MRHHRDDHVLHLDILRIAGSAIALGTAILSADPVGTDQGESGLVLQDRVGRRLDRRRDSQQRAEAGLFARWVRDNAVLDGDLAGWKVPALGRGRNEHRARAGTGLAQLNPGIGDGVRPAGAL